MSKTIKVSAIVADLTTYLAECEKFEKANTIIEKHVSSQIIQVPNPQRNFNGTGGKSIQLPGVGGHITTVMISVIYVHEIPEMAVVKK